MKSMGKPSRNVIHSTFGHRNYNNYRCKSSGSSKKTKIDKRSTSTLDCTHDHSSKLVAEFHGAVSAGNNVNLREGALNFNEWRYVIPGEEEKLARQVLDNKQQCLKQLQSIGTTKYIIPNVPENINIWSAYERRSSRQMVEVMNELESKSFNVM